jgi:methionyl aminopeptidase
MIIIKTKKEIEIIREGGKKLAVILKKIGKLIKPGVSTGILEELACELIKEAGGRPSFKGYKTMLDSKAYPTALCTSINDEVVHAPAKPARILNPGDIIGIDIGMEYPYGQDLRGYYTDMAFTFPVGKISDRTAKLLKVTKRSLDTAIKQVRPGASLNNIGRAVQSIAEKEGFAVVRDLVGHGVGMAVHEEPQIPNYDIGEIDNVILKPGMVLAIEPMVNAGGYRIKNSRDGFTILTADGSLSAHFEHTVAVTEKGYEILTI